VPKQLHVNLFEMNCVSHITHGLWALPDNNRHRFNDIEYWLELAQLLEHGTFDGVFLADVIGTYDRFRGGPATAIREAVQIPSNDPLLVIPAMAAVTRNLGFGATFSTTYEPPFAFARRMSTLDHLTKGRVGWNIVTSYLPNAARNFGHDDEVAHDHRYEIADEYLDVLYKLWEGSWDDDAVLSDRTAGTYADPKKVRYIDHVGEHFRVKGPHLCAPSRQRTPVLFQATGSKAGIAFAGRHAEVVFTGGVSQADVRRNIAEMRAAVEADGRDPAGIKFIVQASVIVDRDTDALSAKLDSYRRLLSVEGRLVHAQSAVDYLAYPRETRLDAIPGADPSRWGRIPLEPGAAVTVGDVIDRLASLDEDRFFAVGTPETVAAKIEGWLDDDGIDGINLRQYHSFDTARDFIELVVPELRRRGRFRERYTEGETLRERLFGTGCARLPVDHVGARYRNPAALQTPVVPLRFTPQGPAPLALAPANAGIRS
jgi:FMN-dependent oxidoreductase (nitrilotriacetate monooxygenase family)